MFRTNALNEMGSGLGEPEMDANSALTELDKGLRSLKLGEQCEAIVRFPNLFEKYPFPILINSAFLKLADVFRTSSNFLRMWVLRVCQQSERHLDKIINVDEFLRRIFSVIHSNDPIARALTLRTLGSLSCLIPERKHVHHSIRVSLDSSDTSEVLAAIYAATCFAKRSKTFANTMCTKISSMIKRVSTPNELKLRLIPVFKYMHHDVTVAATVHSFCQEILRHYPSKEFVITTLHTMTELAAATLSNMKDQVNFLINYLDDPRLVVKLCAIEDLQYLGKKGGHLWEASDISALLKAVQKFKAAKSEDMETDASSPAISESDEKKITIYTLDVLSALTTSSAILTCLCSPDSLLKAFLRKSIQSNERDITLRAISISTSICVNWKSEKLVSGSFNLVEMTANGMDAVLKDLSSGASKTMSPKDIKKFNADWDRCLSYGVSLCKATPSKSSWFCPAVINLLKHGKLPIKTRNVVSQTLGAIGDFKPEAVQKILPDIFQFLENLEPEQYGSENQTIICLVTVILQAYHRYVIGGRAEAIIEKILSNSSDWNRYRIARNALRYGQPGVAAKALDGLSSKVSSENLYYWMSALDAVARAEALLTNAESEENLENRLNQANTLYLKAVMALRAASSPSISLQFQIEYMRIRSEMLIAFSTFLIASGALRFSPPPAISSSIATASRDEMMKSGRIITQLRKNIRDFQTVGELYGRLYQTAFDADNDTLTNLQILQQLCLVMARGIETVVFTKDHPALTNQDEIFTFSEDSINSTLHLTINSCQEAMRILKDLKDNFSNVLTIPMVESFQDAVRIILETPLPYPRFIFQNLQTTRVKIAVSPQPRVAGDNVSVILGNNLALKVEGVINQTTTVTKASTKLNDERESTKGFRKPKAIRLTVTSAPQNTRPHALDGKQLPQDSSTIVKEVLPHKDFFSAQFLLGSWSSGVYQVNVDAAIVDYDGRVWLTGPRATVQIRVLSEVQQNTPLTPTETNKQGVPVPGMPPPPGMIRPGPSVPPGHVVPPGAIPRY